MTAKLSIAQLGLVLAIIALLAGCSTPPAREAEPSPTESQTTPDSGRVPTSTAPPVVSPQPSPAANASVSTATVSPAPTPTAAGISTIAPTRTLLLQEPRLHGADVWAAQQRLVDLEYMQVSAVDGAFGPQTEAAIRRFQTLNDLAVDGTLGPQTWEQLFSPAASTSITKVVPIVRVGFYDSLLIGGTTAEAWLDGPTTATLLKGNERYDLYGFGGALGATASGSRPTPSFPCENVFMVNLSPPLATNQTLAIGGKGDFLPRTPVEVNTDNAVYQQAVTEWLQAQGIAQPDVQITRIVRIDLEGDGAEEVFISATRYLGTADIPHPSAAVGDYSLVIMRKLIDGAVETFAIDAEYYPATAEFVRPSRYGVIAMLDLNGDGRMEVVVDRIFFEGSGTSVYSIDGDQIQEVIAASCGL